MSTSMAKVAVTGEVPNLGKKIVNVAGQEIVLVKVKSVIFAFENECPHQGAPMNAAIVKDSYISCPRHGYRFNLADGKCSEHPEFTLKTFKVELSGEDILVELK